MYYYFQVYEVLINIRQNQVAIMNGKYRDIGHKNPNRDKQ